LFEVTMADNGVAIDHPHGVHDFFLGADGSDGRPRHVLCGIHQAERAGMSTPGYLVEIACKSAQHAASQTFDAYQLRCQKY
jgi:hypothetical protein